MIFIPRTYLESVLIPSTNIHLPGAPLTLGELVQFFGLWMLMATTMGASRRDFWDPEPPSMWTRAPFRLHTYMSRTRFDSIIKALTYTNIVPPAYRDKFHQVRQLLEAFSENMRATFIPSWVSCLDESMSIWTSKLSRPLTISTSPTLRAPVAPPILTLSGATPTMAINAPVIIGSDPGAVPGGSTRLSPSFGACGAEIGSTNDQRGQLSLGEVPPLSVQDHSCQ